MLVAIRDVGFFEIFCESVEKINWGLLIWHIIV
jgi:hypothetical protein